MNNSQTMRRNEGEPPVESISDKADRLERENADLLAILTTGAEPRCPKCEGGIEARWSAPMGYPDEVTEVSWVGCTSQKCGWHGSLIDAIAAGNRVALAQRQGESA